MKCTVLTGALVGALTFGGFANAATITLNLDGVQPRGGHLLIAVQSREQYMKPAATSGASVVGDVRGKTSVTLPDVPAGEYAITVLHDADGDMAMGLDAQGEPLEGWSTRDAQSLKAKPDFDQVKYVVTGDMAVGQTVQYPTRGKRDAWWRGV